MSRQHGTPVILSCAGSTPLRRLALGNDPDQIDENELQRLIHEHPAMLPIREIDPMFADPVPLCREMNTPAGSIDNMLVTPSGLPVLVECKLWRNSQARREVVGQIIDYAKELSRWTASDLQRQVAQRTHYSGNPLLAALEAAGHIIDEVEFTDALTLNLRRGRFLLLIVGDGIREGVEAITEYLQGHSGLHFTLGLVELPVFALPDGQRLITPRILAKTVSITREVINLPEGFSVVETSEKRLEADKPLTAEQQSRRAFMEEVVAGLTLDDPDQPIPDVSRAGWLFLYLPAPASSCWISVLDKKRCVGVRLTSNIGTAGEAAINLAIEDWPDIRAQLSPNVELEQMNTERFRVQEFLAIDRHAGPEQRDQAVQWLRERINQFVSVFRPRIRDAIDQLRGA